jgi:hypothetical protein
MINLVIYLYFNIIDMDNKVKSSVLILLFLVFLILSLNKNIAFNTVLVISLTTIFYNIKKGVSVYLLLGITGIYLSSVLKTKVEGFQTGTTTSVPSIPTTTAEIIDSENEKNCEEIVMSLPLKDLKELNMLFDAVLKFPKEEILCEIKTENLNNIFKLRRFITRYRNRAEHRIDTGSPYYSERALSLSEFIPVYLIDPGLMITLINREKVTLSDLEQDTEMRNRIFGLGSSNILGLKYYFGEKTLTKKHFKIIKVLELDKKLPERVAEDMETRLVSRDYNNYKIKDIVGIAILFEYYGFLGADNELSNNWATGDLGGDKWALTTLSQIDLSSQNSFFKTNSLFKQYKLTRKIDKYLENKETERQDQISKEIIDFSKPLSTEEQGQFVREAVNNIKPDEIKQYHSYLTEQLENKRENDNSDNNSILEFNDLDTIVKKSNTTLTDVIDETRMLVQNLSSDNYSTNSNSITSKYLIFVREFLNILTRDQRMLFVGLFIMILAVVFSFIEINL